MPHCTTNFAWYLGKFIVGFTGMLFLYVGFLKEKEYSCLCRPRMREFNRQKGEKGEKRCDRCQCTEGQRRKLYGCGCKKQTQLNRFSISGCRTTTEDRTSNQNTPQSAIVAAPGGDHNKNDYAYVNAESIERKSRSGVDRNSKLAKSSVSLQRRQSQAQYSRCCCGRDGGFMNKRRRRQVDAQKPSINRRTSEIGAVLRASYGNNEFTRNITENYAHATPNAEIVRKENRRVPPKTTDKGSQRSQTTLKIEQHMKYRWHDTIKSKRIINRTVSSFVKDDTPSTTYFDAVNSFTHDDQKRVESDSNIILGRHERSKQRSAPATSLCIECRARNNVSTFHTGAKSSKSDQRLHGEETTGSSANLLYANTTCMKRRDKNSSRSESKLSTDYIGDCSDRRYNLNDNDRVNEETDSCSCCGKRETPASRSFKEHKSWKSGSRVFKSSSQSDVDSTVLRKGSFENFPGGRRPVWTSDQCTSTTTTADGSFDNRKFGVVSKSKKYARSSRLASPIPSREDSRSYGTDELHPGKRNVQKKISFSRMQPTRNSQLQTMSSRENIQRSLSYQTTRHISSANERKCTCGRNKFLQDETDQNATSGSSIEIRNMSEATLKQLLRARRQRCIPSRHLLRSKSFENETTDSQAGSVCSFSSSFVTSPTENSSQPGRGRGCFCCKRARRANSYKSPRKTYKTTSSSTSSLFPDSMYKVNRTDQATNFETSCTSTCSGNVIETSRLEALREVRRASSSSSSASAGNAKKTSSNDSFLSAVKKRMRKLDSPFEMRFCTARKWKDGKRRSRRKRRKSGIIFKGRNGYDSHESMPCCIEYYEEVQNALLVADDYRNRLPVLEESDRAIDEEDEEDGNVEESSAVDTNAMSEDSWRRVRFMDDETSRECNVIERDDSTEFGSERRKRKSVNNRRIIVTVT